MELAELGRSFRSSASDAGPYEDNEDEVELQWGAIERLPTFERVRTSLFDDYSTKDSKADEGKRVIDVTKLGSLDRHLFIEKLLKTIEEDNHRLLQKLKERIDRVGLELPTVEVRYQNLSVEAESEAVHGESLPTLWNALKNIFRGTTYVTQSKSENKKIKILKDVSGIIKPSRMTLLLGPPGCGKTTLLLALAGKLNQPLKIKGEISYNGHKLNEFVPQKTSSYISQYDLHISEMSVRETLDFSARCQGTGSRAEILMEVSRREKQAGIIPEADIDTFMKAISINGLKRSLQTDYILKILGLDICADTIVGDAMKRGISGGQKKRLTTGEMIVGPTKALFMDEISTGLDSSTTFQIVSFLQQLTHITESTILVSLLQPAPETFDLFDDIILMAEGKIAYHGARDNVLEFLEHCGFRCPARKGIADFLQEVVSKKDQAQYWYLKDQPYSYVSVGKFESIFKEFHLGRKQDEELSLPFNKSESSRNALTFSVYSLGKWDLFKACLAREWLLMKRNSFIHVFKSVQLVVIALVTTTVCMRTHMNVDMIHSNYYMGSLFYAIIRLITNGFAEMAITSSKLPILYKQRDLYFYPAWCYTIPAAILKIPFSFLDAFLWTAITYYAIGYSPEPERFFYQFLILFLLHQVSVSQSRFIASIVQDPSAAASLSVSILLIMYLFGGFIISKPSLPDWLEWGFWISPLTYAQIGASLNEFHAPRWQKVSSLNDTTGEQILRSHGLNFSHYFYWISAGALLGFWIVFNIVFTFALSYSKSPGTSQVTISHQRVSELKGEEDSTNITQGKESPGVDTSNDAAERKNKGMVLPFEPIAISFENVQYYVDTPKKLREKSFAHKRLQLLQDISGAFRPGVLTALMGASGAGKTTLLDVLSGRKTSGIIEGDIRIGGHPKVQETYARISAYCEQTDIHSPHITIEESVTYSAWLRLPSEIDKNTKSEFVAEVLQMIELDEIKHALVGKPGVSGISNEQRKRLTIAVELVSNPSIIFMDEPTSGLDARAAAIVMRVVKNVVRTMRTVVCTIHQPSIDIFETFDELILMKRGGRIIYAGELGQHSSKLIQYFEGFAGVPKFNANRNPATWMLEVTSPSAEAQLGLDFAHIYEKSHLCRENKELIGRLGLPTPGSGELHFSTQFPQNGWEQFKACLWKQHLSYWRNPKYNLIRFIFLIFASLLFAALLWKKGQKIDGEQDFFNIIGPIFILLQFLGIRNCTSIQPYIVTERTVLYRERFAGMYSPWAYSLAQVTIEIPYILLQTLLFVTITYPAINFYWSASKMIWYFYSTFSTLLYFNYFGMAVVSFSPTFEVASSMASLCFTLMSLFAGFIIPGPEIPKWWVWSHWICPLAWSLKAMVTSQYGDINKEISVFGEPKEISAFLKSYYGYHHENLGVVALFLCAFPLIFALAFAFCIAKLNFQRR